MHPRLKYNLFVDGRYSEDILPDEIQNADKSNAEHVLECTLKHVNNKGGKIEFPYYNLRVLDKELSPIVIQNPETQMVLINKFEEYYAGNWSTGVQYTVRDRLGKENKFSKKIDIPHIIELFKTKVSQHYTLKEYELSEKIFDQSEKIMELEKKIETLISVVNQINKGSD